MSVLNLKKFSKVVAATALSLVVVAAGIFVPGSSMTVHADPIIVHQLNAGQTLRAGSTISSPNGGIYLSMQTDGNLVLYTRTYQVATRAIWTTSTSGSGANRVVMQGDGNLVLYTAANKAVWSSRTSVDGSYFSIQDDGNGVIRSGSSAIWQTGSARKGCPADQSDVVFFGGPQCAPKNYSPGKFRISYTGGESLVFEPNGNLVYYHNYRAVWTSNTVGKVTSTGYLSLQSDGNMVIYDSTILRRSVWASYSMPSDKTGNFYYLIVAPLGTYEYANYPFRSQVRLWSKLN